jgi:hypothetical protein
MITTWAEVETYFAGISEAVNLPKPDWAKAETLLDELHTGGLPDEMFQAVKPGESIQTPNPDSTSLSANIRHLREGIAEKDQQTVNHLIKQAQALLEKLKTAN